MQLGVDSRRQVPLIARARPWVALICAAIVFALIPIIGLPLLFALPLIGLALALGAPPDHVADARAVAREPRNLVIGILILICVAVMVLQPQLAGWLVALVGLGNVDLVVTITAVAALALPLAMADSAAPIRDLSQRRPVLTRRNLILCLTVAVTVAAWYAGPGLSYLPIAALVVGLPIPLAVSRLLAARHDRLELGLLRHPLLASLLPHRLQLLNVLLLCGLLAFTLGTGAYDRVAFGFSQGAYRAFVVSFLGGPLVLLLTSLVPLRHVRVASNLLALGGTLFIATQLVMIYRPAVNPVPICVTASRRMVGRSGRAQRTRQLPPRQLDSARCSRHPPSTRRQHPRIRPPRAHQLLHLRQTGARARRWGCHLRSGRQT